LCFQGLLKPYTIAFGSVVRRNPPNAEATVAWILRERGQCLDGLAAVGHMLASAEAIPFCFKHMNIAKRSLFWKP
jgi:hypothetical protein